MAQGMQSIEARVAALQQGVQIRYPVIFYPSFPQSWLMFNKLKEKLNGFTKFPSRQIDEKAVLVEEIQNRQMKSLLVHLLHQGPRIIL